MRRVYLHGELAAYGESFDLEVATAGEAVMALCTNFPAMTDVIKDGDWVLMCGDPATGLSLDEEAVVGMQLGSQDLHIMPDVTGAKDSSGALKVVVGAALIAASFGSAAFLSAPISASLMGATTWGNVIGQLGLAMALGGVSTMLTPEAKGQETGDESKSFTISGPVSQNGQGRAVQIVYGEVITGGMMISGGVDADGMEPVVEEPVTQTDPAETWAATGGEGGEPGSGSGSGTGGE